jgi:hypothetical protein
MSIEDDRIEKLKRKLYSRSGEPLLDVRSDIKKEDESVKSAWGESSKLTIPEDMSYKPKTHPLLKKFLFAASLFFVLSVGFALYEFFGGGNLISSNNVDIKIAGQSVVASGEEVDLVLSLVNQNHTDLNTTLLSIDYPSGTSADKDGVTPLTHTEETVGTVASGSSIDKTETFFLIGDKDAVKTIKINMSYQVAGSNAVFTKEKDYDITIGSSPIILNVDAPQEVNAGKEINFIATVTSNSPAVLHNVLLRADYPYGFAFDTASIKPTTGNTLWNIGDLKSGDKKTINISGTLQAQDGEQRTFTFSVGTKSSDPSKDIDTVLSSAQSTITVSKPFIDAHLVVAGSESPTVTANAGSGVNGVITFTNTLPDQLSNVSVTATLSGSGLDRSSVTGSNNGFYQSQNGVITWDKNSTPAFSGLNPGDSQNVSFSFNTLKLPVGSKNPEVDVALNISGTRVSSSGTVGDVSVSVNKVVKIIANLALLSNSLRSGPFANTGANPPKAESPSTYTIDWSLTNTWNDVTGAKVTTQLPSYVDWTGVISPTTSNISYDASSRTVSWSPDSVSAGAGFTLSPKEVFFQVKINPSLSQVGTIPALTSNINVVGNDTFSGQAISFTSPALTVQTSDSSGSGSVVK